MRIKHMIRKVSLMTLGRAKFCGAGAEVLSAPPPKKAAVRMGAEQHLYSCVRFNATL